ncbi:hypothetical protein QJ854_gp044 [Moumouvirus goulette]|uniref:Uncharacterized protein n=1 Tax=Moumouvirus goulette TaxID=1247379 RepID=M1PI09_9VIRU|nr:hypothetical protein QJ854_gp044 [Moumouvirus goulette]AGF85738.1 hypothetical protein glt_00935 [Moumouvirus goulette]
MEKTNKNFLELVIEKEHVRILKNIIESFCSKKSCKIIFDSSNNNDKKCNIKLLPFDEKGVYNTKIEIQADKLRYFICEMPTASIIVDSQLLVDRFRKITTNDSVIIYMKNTKNQLFIYNLDDNNNHY